jgi:hypothetical protein
MITPQTLKHSRGEASDDMQWRVGRVLEAFALVLVYGVVGVLGAIAWREYSYHRHPTLRAIRSPGTSVVLRGTVGGLAILSKAGCPNADFAYLLTVAPNAFGSYDKSVSALARPHNWLSRRHVSDAINPCRPVIGPTDETRKGQAKRLRTISGYRMRLDQLAADVMRLRI